MPTLPHPLFAPSKPATEPTPVLRRTLAEFPDHFPTVEAARAYLRLIIVPPSMRWGFMSVGKTASSSILTLLFKAEFGTDLTVSLQPGRDINPAAPVHMLADCQVFSRAYLLGLSAGEVLGPKGPRERIVMLREPMQRAASAFRYFCLSDTMQSPWFLPDRLRINAAFGFDWRVHPGTIDGFRLFLRFVEAEAERVGVDAVDGHWRPQHDFIKPAVFQPTITGKMDDMAGFVRALEERLGLPMTASMPWENRQRVEVDPFEVDAEAVALCQRIYARDFDLWES
ncbi:MAG: sulfotransferase family 2 domain-containing protein [Rhodobacter sp.]|nr:sulfotransferase family 2 domain-containing protein [Paracoccaceae bacterium]MCC0077396.1 sulfotransferase family 2 domain-containing protein [Rhodobacter sp.]